MYELTPSLPLIDWLRLLLVYVHFLSCVVALALVADGDRQVLSGTFTIGSLRRTAHRTTVTLMVLWITGLTLVYFDTGMDPAVLAAQPKLLLKILVVTLLTLNGVLLHFFSFPIVARGGRPSLLQALLLAVTGALSTSHWLLAAFVGVSRPLAEYPLDILLSGYAIYCAATLCAAVASVPELRQRFSENQAPLQAPDAELVAQPRYDKPDTFLLPTEDAIIPDRRIEQTRVPRHRPIDHKSRGGQSLRPVVVQSLQGRRVTFEMTGQARDSVVELKTRLRAR